MRARDLIYPILALIIILALWQELPTLGLISPYILPPLSAVIEAFPQLLDPRGLVPGGLIPHLLITLTEAGIAFALSAIVGVMLGLVLAYFKLLREIYEPLIYAISTIPGSIMYPVMYLLFGLGSESKIAFGFFLGVFPLIINIINGSKKINALYIRLAKSVGANELQVFTKVMLPALAPYVVSGLRLAIIFSTVGAVAGELLLASAGLGFAIRTAALNFAVSLTYAYILIVMLLASLFFGITILLERRVLRHYEG